MMTNNPEQSPPENLSDSHYFELDVLRVFAVFMVVVVHVSAPIVYSFGDVPIAAWMSANFYDSLSRMSVPLFFLASGYLILGRPATTSEFYRKRLMKIVVPLMAWSTLYFLWMHKEYFSSPYTIFEAIFSILKAVYLGPVVFHLWFLYVLIGIYLVAPIMRIYVHSSKNNDLIYFIFLWLLTGPFLSLFGKIVGPPSELAEIPVVSGFIGYFVLGYALRRLDFSRKTIWFVGFLVASLIVTFLGTYYLSWRSDQFNEYLYDYLSLNVVVMSASAFVLILNWTWAKKPRSLFQTLSSLSFGIYLIHIFILEVLRKGDLGFTLHGSLASPLWMIPITSLTVFLISALAIAIIRKIPLTKFILP
jgi:surface polysaccharide O-acyltransferase-like enzyme